MLLFQVAELLTKDQMERLLPDIVPGLLKVRRGQGSSLTSRMMHVHTDMRTLGLSVL